MNTHKLMLMAYGYPHVGVGMLRPRSLM